MTGIIIQARVGSTRLPRKMVKPFFHKTGIFELLTLKIKEGFPEAKIVVATTSSPDDNILEAICDKLEVACFRGPEENVLERFILAAEHYKISNVVRICADNPFLNIQSLKNLMACFNVFDTDYLSFKTNSGKPTILTHFGLWAEMVTISALKEVRLRTNDPFYVEHVTNFIYLHPELFRIKLLPIDDIFDKCNLRMTVDTIEDFELLKEIYFQFPTFSGTAQELAQLVSSNKKWRAIMETQIIKNGK